jgi:hypothetical protein
MRTLHIAPGDSAGGSLLKAVRDSGRDEEVLRFRDDLSCGPIHSDTASVRAEWWGQFYDLSEVVETTDRFWNRVLNAEESLVVWFARHSARELAFFLAFVHRLGDRPYAILDVTGLEWPYTRQDGSSAIARANAVSVIPDHRIRTLFGTERPITAYEREEARLRWSKLREENAPFRVVSSSGLVSAPVDYFDALLLEHARPEWHRIGRVVGEALGHGSDPYYQVGDLMLLTRVVALVEGGKLIADGDPWEMRSTRVRLPS